MKSLIILSIALGLSACASNKAAKTTEEAAPAVAAKAAPTKASTAAPKATKSGGGTNCTLGASKRSLEIVWADTGAGSVNYTKDGESSSIANCNAGSTHCQAVVDKVRGNLEGAGFTCTN